MTTLIHPPGCNCNECLSGVGRTAEDAKVFRGIISLREDQREREGFIRGLLWCMQKAITGNYWPRKIGELIDNERKRYEETEAEIERLNGRFLGKE